MEKEVLIELLVEHCINKMNAGDIAGSDALSDLVEAMPPAIRDAVNARTA